MNKVVLIGRLTRDPEVRYSQSAEPLAIARMGIAVNKRFKREGEPDADFINCVAFGKAAELIAKYFRKGRMIAVCGRLSVNSWTDNNGQKRTSTEVIIEEWDFTESKASAEAAVPSSAPAPAPAAGQSQPDGFYSVESSVDDDNLPF